MSALCLVPVADYDTLFAIAVRQLNERSVEVPLVAMRDIVAPITFGIRGSTCPICLRRTWQPRHNTRNRVKLFGYVCGYRHWRSRCVPTLIRRAVRFVEEGGKP